MLLWDSRYHETTRRSFLICGGLSATLKPSLIPTTGSWMGLSNLLQTSSHSCSPSTACSLTMVCLPPSMVCSRGRLQPYTRTCLKKLTLGDPTSLPPSSWTMSLPSTTLLQRCVPQLPDGAATSTSNSPC